MKHLFICILLVSSFSIYISKAQSVGRKPPKITLLDYNAKLDDGNLQFEVDVRMADCISYIEFTTADSKKTIKVKVTEHDYYLNEGGGHAILLRVSIGTLRELLRKKTSMDFNLMIYSKTGKAIYTGQVIFDKLELIASAGTSPSTE